MAYADLASLLARAGRIAPAWDNDTDPDLADLERLLDDVAAEIDAELAARGIGVPATGAAAQALLGMNADGALVLALEATFPEAKGGVVSGMAILEGARGRYQYAVDSIRNGTHSVIRLLESGSAATAGASSFWETESETYGMVGSEAVTEWSSVTGNPRVAPGVYRDQRG